MAKFLMAFCNFVSQGLAVNMKILKGMSHVDCSFSFFTITEKFQENMASSVTQQLLREVRRRPEKFKFFLNTIILFFFFRTR